MRSIRGISEGSGWGERLELGAVEPRRAARLLGAWLVGLLGLGALTLLVQLAVVPGFHHTVLGVAPVFAVLVLAYGLTRSVHLHVALWLTVLVPPLGALLAIRANPDDVFALAFPPLAVVVASGLMATSAALKVAALALVSILLAPLVQPALDRGTVVAAVAFDVIGSCLVLVHVSYRARLERELAPRLREQDRLATLGTLAASTAHELVGALTVATLSARAIERQLLEGRRPDEVSQSLGDIREGLLRMEVIVRGLRGLSRDDGGQEIADPNEVVESALGLARATVVERARVELQLEQVPAVRGHRVRLGQVLLNLISNAVQALPEGRAENRVRISTAVGADGWVEVCVEDNGAGIPAELLPRVFEPFFTTKPAGEGTGLGLHVSRSIVEECGGRLVAESRPGEPTRFRMRLPPARA